MKKFVNGFFLSFSIYSIIPMPQLSWDDRSKKYIFYFFPFIGLLIGLVNVLWYNMALGNINIILFAAVASIIPIIISGGIHLDGYIDTCDALSSHADIAKKRAILKDPHVGAFGVIYTIIYFIILIGLYAEFYDKHGSVVILFCAFFLSRVMGAFASVLIKPATDNGMLYSVSKANSNIKLKVVLSIYIVVALIGISLYISLWYTCILFLVMVFSLVGFNIFANKKFGGISGDLAGFYISILELILILLAVVAVEI